MSFIKKNLKVLIIVLFAITTIAVSFLGILLFKKTNGLKTFENDYYSIMYSKKWDIIEKESKLSIINKDAIINIYRLQLSNKDRSINSEDLLNFVVENIKEINNDLKITNYIKNSNTMNNYKGIQVLLSNNNEESLITIIHKNCYIYIMEYSYRSDLFDYYLNDVLDIIWEIKIK